MTTRTRTSVMIGLQAGDPAAWATFERVYHPILLKVARAWGLQDADAQDVAADCLVSILAAMKRFEYDQGKGFRKWLRTIVKNRIRNFWRKKREVRLNSGVAGALPEPTQPAVAAIIAIEQAEFARRCLQETEAGARNPKNIQAFRMIELEGKSIDDTCRRLEMTRAQVHLAKHRVLQRVRDCVERTWGSE